MNNQDHQTYRYGPAAVTCPYCLEEVEVGAGPTRICEIDHCGEGWMVVDLVDGKAGKASDRNE